MKGNVRLGFILAVFAAIGCASLAVVYSVTKPSIEMQDKKALEDSLKELFPDAAAFEDVSASLVSKVEGVTFDQVFLVKSSEAPLGLAVKASGSSYGGTARILVGEALNHSLAGVRVLELNDTPGLGANAKNPNYFVKKAEKITFPGQFAGKPLTDAFEVKKDVAAITAATITSRSLTKVVKAAAEAAAAWLEAQNIGGQAVPAGQAAAAQVQPAAAKGGK